MKKKSKDYWIRRALEDENKSNLKSIETYKKQERVLKNTELELKNIIEKYLHDMSWHNNLSMTKMKEILDKKEKEELNWILQDYILYAKEYEKYLKNSPEAKELDRKLKNASRNFRMTKEQAMLTEVRKELVKLGVEQNKVLENHLKETVQETRENNLPKLPVKEEPLKLEDKSQENATPLSENFKTVDEAINEKWVGGKNFSERIWKDTDRLNKYLEEELPKSISRGDAGKKLINDIQKQFEVSKANAKRLVFTETSRIYSKTRLKSFMDLGVKFVEILATLDLRTSEICRNKDGLKIEIANAKIGVDLPPFHPYCRTVFTPVLDEDLEKKLRKNNKEKVLENKNIKSDKLNSNSTIKENVKKDIDKEDSNQMNLDTSDLSNIKNEKEVKNVLPPIVKQTTFDEKTVEILENEFGKLWTNEVVLFAERVEHIREGHSIDVEYIVDNYENIIKDYDLLIKDPKKENTVWFIKTVEVDTSVIYIKLSVQNYSNTNYKNSTITGHTIKIERILNKIKEGKLKVLIQKT